MNWLAKLAEATTPTGVIDLANECVESIAPETLSSFPEGCRPAAIELEDDIHYWHSKLASEMCVLPPMSVYIKLQELAIFLLRASDRLRELHEDGDATVLNRRPAVGIRRQDNAPLPDFPPPGAWPR